MKKALFIFSLLLMQQFGYSQAPVIQWQKTYGGSLYDIVSNILQTSDGGYILGGQTQSNNGYVTNNHGYSDIWIIKISATGILEWQKTFGGTDFENGAKIKQTLDGGFIFQGATRSNNSNVTFNYGGTDIWVVKISSTGDIQWEKTFGGSGEDYSGDIIQTLEGGYIMTGYTNSINGDILGNHGGYDSWIVKLSSLGNIQWQKTLGGTNEDRLGNIIQIPDGSYIFTGYTKSIDGDIIFNHGQGDFWAVKLSVNGILQWQKTYGGSGDEASASCQITTDGGFVMSGYTYSNDGDVSGNHGGNDAWIVKVSNIGFLEWQKTFGGTAFDSLKGIQLTLDGGYVATGVTNSNNGDVTGNHGSDDFWVVKMSNTGLLQWQKTLGGTNQEGSASIKQTTEGGYIVSGYTFSSNGDVTTNNGGQDYWIVKLSADTLETSNFDNQELNIFPNPTNSILNFKTDKFNEFDKIVITDLTEKIILEQMGSISHLNIEKFPTGLYFLKVEYESKKFVNKFIKY